MTAGELLDEVRDFYLKEFAVAAACFSEDGSKLILEPALRDENGNLLFEDALGLPMRADLVTIRNGEAQDRVHVDTNKMISFEPLSFEWPGGVEVTLAPFQWEDCEVRVKCIGAPIDWAPLKKWFIRWFDPEETNTPDEKGSIFCQSPSRKTVYSSFPWTSVLHPDWPLTNSSTASATSEQLASILAGEKMKTNELGSPSSGVGKILIFA